MQADLEISVKHKVPLIITSLGAVKELVGAVQGYGGLVFHDVINMRHARKAAEADVDGLIAVCAGAGGHAGLLSPFALVPEIRQFFPKTILLSGVMSTGRHIAAARMLGADLAYLGTRFIATRESMAPAEFKDMIVVDQRGRHRLHGGDQRRARQFPATRASTRPACHDRSHRPTKQLDLNHEKRAWKNVWSAGQGVGSIEDVPTTAELCARLMRNIARRWTRRPRRLRFRGRLSAGYDAGAQGARRADLDRGLGRADDREGASSARCPARSRCCPRPRIRRSISPRP